MILHIQYGCLLYGLNDESAVSCLSDAAISSHSFPECSALTAEVSSLCRNNFYFHQLNCHYLRLNIHSVSLHVRVLFQHRAT